MHNVIESLIDLVEPIDGLRTLPGNSRRGDVSAIAESLREFGQHVPIVVQDSTNTVLKGNNTLEAAKLLGWNMIAVARVEDGDDKAVARALIDNRTSELGSFDEHLRSEQIVAASTYAPEVFEAAGWDRYELAEIEVDSERSSGSGAGGFEPPELVKLVGSEGSSTVEMPEGADVAAVVTQGAGVAGIQSEAKTKAVMQYTVVFDSPEQHARWFKFLRWLRTDPGFDGDTIAERVMNFIDAHADFDS